MAIFISVAIVAAFAIWRIRKASPSVKDDLAIKRTGRFWAHEEMLLAKGVNFESLVNDVKRFNPPESTAQVFAGQSSKYIEFKSTLFTAELNLAGYDPNTDVSGYLFRFLTWSESAGMPQYVKGMNMLQTAVEKAFLVADPNTMVNTRKDSAGTSAF